MTQIEQIKAEIERRIKALEKTFPNTYYEGEVCGLKRLLSFIESMEKDKNGGSEKPNSQSHEKNICDGCVNDKGCVTCVDGDMKETQSQGLHEAACEYAKEQWPESWYQYYSAADFKAGAKWAAEHGVSYDSTVIHGANNMLFVTALLDGKDFKKGDKVTVQIRKK